MLRAPGGTTASPSTANGGTPAQARLLARTAAVAHRHSRAQSRTTVARTLTRNLGEALARRTIGALAQLRRVEAQVGPVEQRVYRHAAPPDGCSAAETLRATDRGALWPYCAGEDVPLAADDAHALVAHAAGEEERRASGRAERLRGKVEERAAADKLARVVELYDKEARLVDVPAEARLHALVANNEHIGHHEVSDVDAKRGRKARQDLRRSGRKKSLSARGSR